MAKAIARSGFDLDLKFGQSRENALSNILRGDKTVEVKSDAKCRTTGNVFVEFEQKGVASGIAVTTAEYWAFEVDDDQWVIIPTVRLKVIARHYFRQGKVRTGGDYNAYRGVLIPVEALVNNRISIVTRK